MLKPQQNDTEFEELPQNITLQPDDHRKLVNLSNFEYLIKSNSCDTLQPPDILILIHSAPWNFHKRQTIRQGWGKISPRTQLRFFLGTVNSTTLQEKINSESETYEDLVQGNFHDSYRNLTYKHVMVLKWFVYECSNAKFLLKTDDDVFIDILKLLSDLDNEKIAKDRLIFCTVNENANVGRKDTKWAVTYEEYAEDVYPPYCQGYAILYSADVIKPLYWKCQSEKFFWIDDTFVTGIVRLKLKLELTSRNALSYFELRHSGGSLVRGGVILLGLIGIILR